MIAREDLDTYFSHRRGKDYASMTRTQIDAEISYVESILDFNASLNGCGLEDLQRGIVEGDLRSLNAEKARRNGAENRTQAGNSSISVEDDEAPHCTDLGNAARMAALFGSDIKYSTALGWLCWDGKRWRRDDTEEIERIARRRFARFTARRRTSRTRAAARRWRMGAQIRERVENQSDDFFVRERTPGGGDG